MVWVVVVGGPFGFAILLPMPERQGSQSPLALHHTDLLCKVSTQCHWQEKNKNTSVMLDCFLIHKSLQKTPDLHCTTCPVKATATSSSG